MTHFCQWFVLRCRCIKRAQYRRVADTLSRWFFFLLALYRFFSWPFLITPSNICHPILRQIYLVDCPHILMLDSKSPRNLSKRQFLIFDQFYDLRSLLIAHSFVRSFSRLITIYFFDLFVIKTELHFRYPYNWFNYAAPLLFVCLKFDLQNILKLPQFKTSSIIN